MRRASGGTLRTFGDGKSLWWDSKEGLVLSVEIIGEDQPHFGRLCLPHQSHAGRGDGSDFERCKEVSADDADGVKFVDNSIVYAWVDGRFQRRLVKDIQEIMARTDDACKADPAPFLCKMPGYLSAAEVQNAAGAKNSYPNAPKTARTIDAYRKLKLSMTLDQAIAVVGTPDEWEGSGLTTIVYYLYDGSIVFVSGSNGDAPITGVWQLDRDGVETSLTPQK